MGADKLKQEELRGFAGLASLVSDVAPALAQAEKLSRQGAPAGRDPLPPKKSEAAAPVRADTNSHRAASPERSTAAQWLVVIGVVGGLIWLLSGTGKRDRAPALSSPTASSGAASSAPRLPEQPVVSPWDGRPEEAIPGVGTNNILSLPQIRYCVAEDIRLTAASAVVDENSELAVNRFNRMIMEYNNRCGAFRYRPGTVESARAQMEPYRAVLENEGKRRFAPLTTSRQKEAPRRRVAVDAGPMAPTMPVAVFGDEVATVPPAARGNRTSEDRQGAKPAVTLTSVERQSIESACSIEKHLNGPAAYEICVKRHMASLIGTGRRPNLDALTASEVQSIESACSSDKHLNGPAAYNECLRRKLAAANKSSTRPSLSRLSQAERESIESVCAADKYLEGPAAYNLCLSGHLKELERGVRRPDLSHLTAPERDSAESACSVQKYTQGPAAYNACLSHQLSALVH